MIKIVYILFFKMLIYEILLNILLLENNNSIFYSLIYMVKRVIIHILD